MARHTLKSTTSVARGMTLVELLVVVVILLLLLVSVGPLLAPSDSLRGRESAATVGAMVRRAQARAATNGNRGAGIWLEPISTDTSGRATPSAAAPIYTPPSRGALDIFACEPQDPYVGDDPESALVYVHRVKGNIQHSYVDPNIFTPPITRFVDLDANFPSTDAIVVFSSLHCSSLRPICSQSTRMEIDGKEFFLLKIFSAAEQQVLRGNSPGLFPEPYRPWHPPDYVGADIDVVQLANQYTYTSGSQPPYSFKDNFNQTHLAPDIILARIREENTGDLPAGSSDLLLFNQPPAAFPATPAIPAVGIGEHNWKIFRPLTRSATPPLTLPDGYCIDIAWSCIGYRFFHNAASSNGGLVAGSLPGMPSYCQTTTNFLSDRPLQILFNRDGGLSGVGYRRGLKMGSQLVEVEDTLPPTHDVYLLIGRVDRAGNPYVPGANEDTPGANWQYPDSRWVKIAKNTGTVLIADPVYGATDVIDSQQYARNDIPAARN